MLGKQLIDWFIDVNSRQAAEGELAKMKEPPQKGKRPTGSDRKHYSEAQEHISRAKGRTLKRLGGLLGGTLIAVVAGGLAFERENTEQNPEQYSSPGSGPENLQKEFAGKIHNALMNPDGSIEKTTDATIQKAEQGMANLWKKLKPHIDRMPQGYFRDQIESPFVISRINADNPEKNAVLVQRAGRERKEDVHHLGNDNYFTYLALSNMPPGFAAGFEPPGRMLSISSNFDPNNPLDLLVLYHELRHVVQDASRRHNMNIAPTPTAGKKMFEDYLRFSEIHPGERPRIIVNEEATAYAFEMEILNLLTNGRLKELSEQPDPRITIGEGLGWLDVPATQDNLGVMDPILRIALNYFPDGLSKGGLTIDYSDRIAEYHEKVLGYEIYEQVPGRGLFPYKYGEARSPDTSEQPKYLFY